MNKTQIQLNLARKWRSKQFDQVVGQDLPVRILQNSLYSNQFFPVYLFSGQRGCGKTTSARLFAAALNCEQLEHFQKSPRDHKLPCLMCASCVAMTTYSHPDFIEIDAASYTGVDNVREIIESASLLPVLGRKKLYLIDEAHMLSKAAFNAFLKILEEPPASVIFMLATTDPHKILETVRSRCFQLFFTPIAPGVMGEHLAAICVAEGIAYDESALRIIAAETEGSARDAINLLEQVRFSQPRITADAVLTVLGHMPEKQLLDLFECTIRADMEGVIAFFAALRDEHYVPLALWQKSTELVRNLLFIKQGLNSHGTLQDVERATQLSRLTTLASLVSYLKLLYAYELPLLRSTVQKSMLEMLFIELCCGVIPTMEKTEHPKAVSVQKQSVPAQQPVEQKQTMPAAAVVQEQRDERWQAFMTQIGQLSDPLLQSIFKQGRFASCDERTHEITVLFEREAGFFTDWLNDTKNTWGVLLEGAFGTGAHLKPVFGEVKNEQKTSASVAAQVTSMQQTARPEKVVKATESPSSVPVKRSAFSKSVGQPAAQELNKELAIDISDEDKWQKAHLLKEVFGGSVVAIQEDENYDETGQ